MQSAMSVLTVTARTLMTGEKHSLFKACSKIHTHVHIACNTEIMMHVPILQCWAPTRLLCHLYIALQATQKLTWATLICITIDCIVRMVFSISSDHCLLLNWLFR